MLSLLNAIYSHFTASLASTFPGGLHRDRAPEGTAMPYVVSRVVSAQTQYAYGGSSRSLTKLRLSAFGVGHDATGVLAQSLVLAFDSTLLTLGTGTNDTVAREADPVPGLHSHDSQGNDVWEWAVVYEYGTVES
jgi:hypothetical protein